MNKEIILGIHDGRHNAAAAILDGGRIVAAVQEERLTLCTTVCQLAFTTIPGTVTPNLNPDLLLRLGTAGSLERFVQIRVLRIRRALQGDQVILCIRE